MTPGNASVALPVTVDEIGIRPAVGPSRGVPGPVPARREILAGRGGPREGSRAEPAPAFRAHPMPWVAGQRAGRGPRGDPPVPAIPPSPPGPPPIGYHDRRDENGRRGQRGELDPQLLLRSGGRRVARR